jgi:hypothetical protein
VIRLGDKFHRLKTFCVKGSLENESLDDTLKDLAAYSLLSLVLYREQQAAAIIGDKACEL